MATYAIAKAEFSPDPLSDTTPTYIDVTRYCQGCSWFGGVTKDTDSPQAGGATFVLKNKERRFEPEYTAGAYYPNIVPGRRFRLTVTADGVNYAQGTYYAREWSVDYPDRSLGYSVVTVACSDGFWRLSVDLLPTLSPLAAASYADVIATDSPLAHFPLSELGGNTVTGDPGPDGTYRGGVPVGSAVNPVLGDPAPAPRFPSFSWARIKAEDADVFADAGQFTMECVATLAGPEGNACGLMALPYHSGGGGFNQAQIMAHQCAISASVVGISDPGPGAHHFAFTWDGSTAIRYVDGVATHTLGRSGALDAADANDFLYIHTTFASKSGDPDEVSAISHAAFYDYALSAARIQAHATAALNRGYATQTSGARIALLATDPLWSTAGIPTGTVTVTATSQHGQPVVDEIHSAADTEAPGSLFYFTDAGNPAYRALLDTWTPAATFGDTAAEVGYSDIQLAYDDDLFNSATVSGPGLEGASAVNAQSLADYGNRGVDQTSLPITKQADAALLAQTYVDRFSSPQFRCESITLNGKDQNARTQILTREIGDVIRVRRRGEGGVPIDIITRILGKSKSLDVHGDLRCTWSLARGFNATLAQWHLNTSGFGELGQTTTLA